MSSSLEIFVWAIAGGTFILLLTVCTSFIQNGRLVYSKKHLSRDFLLGAAFTGFVYPLLPETFDTMKGAISSTAGGAITAASDVIAGSSDADVKIGPANF